MRISCNLGRSYKINSGLTARFNGNMLVAPLDGVHCGSNVSKRKTFYLLTYFERFQA